MCFMLSPIFNAKCVYSILYYFYIHGSGVDPHSVYTDPDLGFFNFKLIFYKHFNNVGQIKRLSLNFLMKIFCKNDGSDPNYWLIWIRKINSNLDPDPSFTKINYSTQDKLFLFFIFFTFSIRIFRLKGYSAISTGGNHDYSRICWYWKRIIICFPNKSMMYTGITFFVMILLV